MIEQLLLDVASKYTLGQAAYETGRLFKNLGEKEEMNPFEVTKNQNPIFALGTAFNGMNEVEGEVEGGEVIETPDGQVEEVKGARHEQGGVKGLFPEGTKVFSDRIKVDGKTMAERKKERETLLSKLDALLQQNPQDKLLRNTAKAQAEKIVRDDFKDLGVQGEVQQALGQLENDFMMYGGIMKKYANGTPPSGMQKIIDTNFAGKDVTPIYNAQALGKDYVYFLDNTTGEYYYYNASNGKVGQLNQAGIDNVKKAAFDSSGNLLPDFSVQTTTSAVPTQRTPLQSVNIPVIQATNTTGGSRYRPSNMANTMQGVSIGVPLGNSMQGVNIGKTMRTFNQTPQPTFDDIFFNSKFKDDKVENDPLIKSNSKSDGVTTNADGSVKPISPSDSLDLTLGDKLGLAGNVVGGLGPLAVTMANRGGDTPNINAFQNFGKDALADIEEAQGIAGRNLDQQLRELELSTNAQQRANQNNARSVNQLRGLQQGTYANKNKAINQAYTGYNNMLGQLLTQEAGLENQQDQVVMGGEQQRDLADRQDRDNFFTQLAQNVATASEFTQKTGRDLNVKQTDKDFLDILPATNSYGFGFTRDPQTGKLVMKKMN